MIKTLKVVILVVLILVIGSFVIKEGVFFSKKKTQDLTKVSLRLKWLDQAQFAGYYMANSQGLYAEKGLKVEINSGGPDISPVQMVMTGVNNFGITGADQIILAREKGVPLVALAVIYRESPVVMLSLKESNIKTPKDFEGKKVAVVYGRDEETIYRALLNKDNVNVKKIKELPCLFDLRQLIEKKIDAQVGYETNEVILLNKEGYESNVIKPKDYGINFYADTLFTTEEMINNYPELVKDFVQATVKGWEFALKNPDQAIDEVLRINPTLDREHQSKSLANSNPLINSLTKIGYSDILVWEEMEATLISQGLLKGNVDLQEVFTNEYLP